MLKVLQMMKKMGKVSVPYSSTFRPVLNGIITGEVVIVKAVWCDEWKESHPDIYGKPNLCVSFDEDGTRGSYNEWCAFNDGIDYVIDHTGKIEVTKWHGDSFDGYRKEAHWKATLQAKPNIIKEAFGSKITRNWKRHVEDEFERREEKKRQALLNDLSKELLK